MIGLLDTSMIRVARFLSSALFLQTLTSCKCDADVEMEATLTRPEDFTLLDPDEGPSDPGSRCRPAIKEPYVLRAQPSGGSDPSSVEVSGGAFHSGGFSILGTRTSDSTQALLGLSDGLASLREVDLGRLLGAVEPPYGFGLTDAILVLVQDSDAMGRRMRLMRVDLERTAPRVTRGPELSVPRDDSAVVSLAVSSDHAGLLVWDESDKSSLRSRIVGLPFDARTLKESGSLVVLSDEDEDAEEPLLVAGHTGFVVSYVRLKIDSNSGAEDEPLVREPERVLVAKRANASGSTTSGAELISAGGEHVLAFDAVAAGESILFAYRATRVGHTIDEDAVTLARLALDGSVTRGLAEHQRLGPGSPILLSEPGRTPWLLSRGRDAETLLAEVSDLAEVQFHNEPLLDEHIPLSRSGDQLLSMKPFGLDWAIETFDCATTAP